MKRKKRRRNAACAGGRGQRNGFGGKKKSSISHWTALSLLFYQFYHIINRAMRSNSIRDTDLLEGKGTKRETS